MNPAIGYLNRMESEQQNNGTAFVATTPNKRPPTELDLFKTELSRDYVKQVNNFFMGDKERAMKFMSAATYSVQKTPALLQCDKASLYSAFMACAEWQLYPSNVSGEAYVIPYKGKAQFQLGYQGIITLLYRAGAQSIQSNIVYKNDVLEYEEGLNPVLVHKFNPFATSKERGAPKGVYVVAIVNGQKMFKVMSEEDVMQFRNLSQAKDSSFSPWNSDKDPELWMWRKTCIKQLAKTLPKNDAIMKALAKDNEDSVIHVQQANLDADGPAVGRAMHEPETTPQ